MGCASVENPDEQLRKEIKVGSEANSNHRLGRLRASKLAQAPCKLSSGFPGSRGGGARLSDTRTWTGHGQISARI